MIATPSINGQAKRSMMVPIDTSVTFQLSGGREVTVDALELDDFVRLTWEKAAPKPWLDANEQPILENGEPQMIPKFRDGEAVRDAQGKLVPARFLDPEVSEAAMRAWLQEEIEDIDGKKAPRCTVKLKPSEVRGIWQHAQNIWQKKSLSWHEPAPASPTSPPSSDPRYSD